MNDKLRTQLEAKLQPFDQSHLLTFWDELNSVQRNNLAAQIASVDFELLEKLFEDSSNVTDWSSLAARSTSPPAVRLAAPDELYRADDAKAAGKAALENGQVGIIVVAGGQGSRLGFPHPKGMYPLGPVSQRTLFQIHADRIVAANRRYGVSIPWYVMTSPATDGETIAYFDLLDQDDLPWTKVFCQGTMPAVDAKTGKALLEEKGQLFESPDGHGGTLAALHRTGCLADMRSRGIRQLVYFQVDNPLVDLCDPKFIGYHLLAGSEMTSQVVAKSDPHEKVGAVVAVDGELHIIEYSDLPQATAEHRNPDGSLFIWAGSIAVHVFDVEFLLRVTEHADSLPFHRAHKSVPFVDNAGERIQPEAANAIKFERFIFDLLPLARNGLVVEVDEAEAFAPLKNASSEKKDTAETARAAMVNQHRRWLEAAGAKLEEGVLVEINPLFAADVDELRERIEPNLAVTKDHYFSSSRR